MFTFDWFFTLFSRDFDIRITRIVWDKFLILGDFYLIKTAHSIFQNLESEILSESSNGHLQSIRAGVAHISASRLTACSLSQSSLDLSNRCFSSLITSKVLKRKL